MDAIVFFIGMTAFDQVSKHNTTSVYIRFAFGEPVDVQEQHVTLPDYYIVRDLDNMPGVFSAEELFKAITPI